ncbi:MAG: CDP-alcohol phosphatidyltransferase family protein [Balneolales bacterium]
MELSQNIDGRKIKVKGDWYTVSNLISFSRILTPIPLILLHQQFGEAAMAWLIFLTAYIAISDYLDGLAARKLDQITELGKFLDPLADKICASILFIYTVYLELIPLEFFGVLLIRDSLILAGSFFIKKKHGKVAMSVMSGKIYVNLLSLYWIVAFFMPTQETLKTILLTLTLILMMFSFFVYAYRFYMIQKGSEFN